MKAQAVTLGALLFAGSALADPYNIVKQQAHRVVDQNAAEQARIQKAAADPVPTDPALQATLQNIGDLQASIAGFIKTDGPPDTAQKNSLLNNLSQAAQGSKASSDSVKKLAADLAPALAQRKTLTAIQQRKLAVDIHALFNSSHLSATQQATMFDDVQKMLAAAGAGPDDAAGIVTDLKKIAGETK